MLGLGTSGMSSSGALVLEAVGGDAVPWMKREDVGGGELDTAKK